MRLLELGDDKHRQIPSLYDLISPEYGFSISGGPIIVWQLICN